MLTYQVTAGYLELTATGGVSAAEAEATFRTMSGDQGVPEGLPLLLDLRQYDVYSMSPEDLPDRVLRMFALLGPKLGGFWAVVIDDQIAHFARGRLLQQLAQNNDATVMLFPDVVEAREWLAAMTSRRVASKSSPPST